MTISKPSKFFINRIRDYTTVTKLLERLSKITNCKFEDYVNGFDNSLFSNKNIITYILIDKDCIILNEIEFSIHKHLNHLVSEDIFKRDLIELINYIKNND